MYEKRVKVLIGISLAVLLVCVLRLAQMQLRAGDALQEEIARLKELQGRAQQFQTLRGKIFDRRGEILAADMPQFQIGINYRLSCFFDERVLLAKYAVKLEDKDRTWFGVYKEVAEKKQDLQQIIDKCSRLGVSRREIEARIRAFNDSIWNTKSFLYWVRDDPNPNVIAQYGGRNSVPLSVALAELKRRYPEAADRNERIAGIGDQDIPETGREQPLVELRTEDDVFNAQLEFTDLDEVEILPMGHRYYSYRRAAAQTIGWVGGATQPSDTKVFAGDPLASYLDGEVCGRDDGVEYVCESILRGRRGEIVKDLDGQLVRETETELGQDVQLTLDIKLQEQIERQMTDPQINPEYARVPMAAALLDVRSGDILALVSLPSYDLNVARYHIDELRLDPNRPTVNRAINYSHYPPGSVAKPVVLIAGLESGAITPGEPISCPAAPAPPGWPNCWIWRQSHATGHDSLWVNNAHNATKGSCNCYFSHLADRIESEVLQGWFLRFGYGRQIPLSCPTPAAPGEIPRLLRQYSGEIGSEMSSAYPDGQVPPLLGRDRKMFGIGQGNFRVTPLQVANAFATIARGGRSVTPRLFLNPESPRPAEPNDLPISPGTLKVVYEGMHAVVNERGGTAYEAFAGSSLTRHGVKVYGKTGSTERPFHAWFAGFAEDKEGAKLALAVVVESGQHGGRDAGPLAREILELCVQAGYVGSATAGR